MDRVLSLDFCAIPRNSYDSMIYVIGILGFVAGFALGQMILMRLLKNISRDELLNNPTIRWKYGTLCWIVAVMGAYSAVMLYKIYFPGP